jgi:hypothetical protein
MQTASAAFFTKKQLEMEFLKCSEQCPYKQHGTGKHSMTGASELQSGSGWIR